MATTSKSAASKSTASKSRTAAPKAAPAPAAHLSLADLETESRSEIEPFRFDPGDGLPPIEIGHPGEIAFEILADNDVAQIIAAATSPEDYDRLLSCGISGLQFGVIVQAWRKYYGTGTEGE